MVAQNARQHSETGSGSLPSSADGSEVGLPRSGLLGVNPLLERSAYESDGGRLVGRDPRTVPAEDWDGRHWLVGMKAIRAKCLDCCAEDASEVRKCVSTSCALWPLRMSSVPSGWREAAGGAE